MFIHEIWATVTLFNFIKEKVSVLFYFFFFLCKLRDGSEICKSISMSIFFLGVQCFCWEGDATVVVYLHLKKICNP